MTPRQADAGFTLVEVLVSLALLSVLSIYTLSAIRLQKDMDRMAASISRNLEVSAALSAMEQQLKGMQLVFVPVQTEQRNLVFEGHEGSVAFAGLSDGSRIEGGLYRVTFVVDETHRLMAKFGPMKAGGFGTPVSIVMLEHVKDLHFLYSSMETDSSLVSDWQGIDRLPELIDVHLTLDDTASSTNSSETANLRIAVETARTFQIAE